MNKTKNITLNVEGMTCSNCALGIKKQLEKKGLDNVSVNFSTGEVSYNNTIELNLKEVADSINSLGFKVVDEGEVTKNQEGISTIEKQFYFTLFFTIPLFLHMFFPHDFFLNNVWVQLGLCLPVFSVGVWHFGKSAIGSLKTGVPNMDVLIIVGITSAFGYSLYGSLAYYGLPEAHNYLFFETAATITTLVLLGNVLEYRSVKQTTTAIKELNQLQKTEAKRVLSDGKIELVEYDDIKVNDILQFNTGDKVAVDGEVIWGDAIINEAMISGESVPLSKGIGSKVIGGTIVEGGTIKIKAEQVGDKTVLAKIIELVKNAQQDEPQIQRLGDKVSAIFVPVVIGLSLITFSLAFFVFNISLQQSVMQAIAVLVISCPCAMGLATPTAVMVGIGRAAKKGILIKGGSTFEQFANAKNIVFDKTGTLTTGNFVIKKTKLYTQIEEQELKNILFSLEQNSSHPIAKSIANFLMDDAVILNLVDIKEIKGFGIEAKDIEGNIYQLGSSRFLNKGVESETHSIYLVKNNELIAGVDIEDELKENVAETIALLNKQGLNTILLSGDRREVCDELAAKIGIKTVFSQQLPEQKLAKIDELQKTNTTVMVGDGINDAPALAKASVSISISNATQVAVQTAKIVLLNDKDLSQVYEAFLISKHTLKTIKQNLFWAFFYNVVAIPIAAFGFLNPMVAALTMAFSDVIVIGNSIRLKSKKLK
ncbi:cadmium-translocating P-type ATPase [Vicingus serpentipes]|uniref:Cadmium-translocating P-type ATPase n=1 Tax=Vicingus serpentipes TaxID=1926625 RepID=A0A5C6RWY0_9FLAO|nr:cation-translocating P-type ATPase [Vicingus serpentipes]TXB66693.1 cadmium-translocating P-type ATPase [Vicingus serpentipes]